MTARTRDLLAWIWSVAVALSLAYLLITHRTRFLAPLRNVAPVAALTVVTCLIAAKVFLTKNCQQALKRSNIQATYGQCFLWYNLTQLGKYMPGSVWQFVGRAALYGKAGMSGAVIRDVLILENAYVLTGATIVGLVLIAASAPITLSHKLFSTVFPLLLVAACLIAVASSVRRSRAYLLKQLFNSRPLLPLLLVQVAVWFLLGFGYWFPFAAIKGFTLSYAIGLFALAYIAGLLAPFAPAGIGVRELVLVAGTVTVLGEGSAASAAILNRALYLFSELLLALVVFLLQRRSLRVLKPGLDGEGL